MVNRRLDFLFFLSAQLFRASLLSFLYRSLRSLSVDLKVSFTAPSGLATFSRLELPFIRSAHSRASLIHSHSFETTSLSRSLTVRL